MRKKEGKKPQLIDATGKVMAQLFIRFTCVQTPLGILGET